jgi:hypothetical protein
MAEDVSTLNFFLWFTASPFNVTSRNKEKDITNSLFFNNLSGEVLVYTMLELFNMNQLDALQDGKITDKIRAVLLLWGSLYYAFQHFLNTD